MSISSQVSSSSQSTQCTKEELDRKGNEVVSLFLVWQKKKAPLKRSDIIKYVVKNQKIQKSSFNAIFDNSCEKLKTTFGFIVQEVGEGAKKSYILLNRLEYQQEEPLIDHGNHNRGLLTFVVALIFMMGDQVNEEALWHKLKSVNVERGQEHPIFGDVKKVFLDFARQQYLTVEKEANSNPPTSIYSLGPRCYHEISKREILRIISELHQHSDIAVWKSQYDDVLRGENK